MRRSAMGLIGLLFLAGVARAAEPQGKIVRDLWDAAYLDGTRTGFFHTTVTEVERGGKKVLQASMDMDLQIRRYNATIRLRMLTGSEETPEGKVLGVSMTQFLDRDKKLVLTGTVEGEQLHVKVQDPPIDKMIPWNDKVIGLYQQERLYQEKKAKPGDRIKYQSFEPTFNSVVTIEAIVKDFEEVDVLQVKKGTRNQVEWAARRLLRVEAVPEKISVPGSNVSLPTMVSWLGSDLLPVRSEVELTGLGKIQLYRTTREMAISEGGQAAKLPDVGLNALIPLNRQLLNPHDTKKVVYRITLKGDDDPATAFGRILARQSRMQRATRSSLK